MSPGRQLGGTSAREVPPSVAGLCSMATDLWCSDEDAGFGEPRFHQNGSGGKEKLHGARFYKDLLQLIGEEKHIPPSVDRLCIAVEGLWHVEAQTQPGDVGDSRALLRDTTRRGQAEYRSRPCNQDALSDRGRKGLFNMIKAPHSEASREVTTEEGDEDCDSVTSYPASIDEACIRQPSVPRQRGPPLASGSLLHLGRGRSMLCHPCAPPEATWSNRVGRGRFCFFCSLHILDPSVRGSTRLLCG